jgi:hypothetical protein
MLKNIFAHGVGGIVDRAAEGEPYAAGDQGVADVAGAGYRPGEPVEFRHDEGVAGTDGGQRLVEAGPAAVGAGQPLVQVDPVGGDPEPGEGMTLRGEVLGVGETAGVADQRGGHVRQRTDSPRQLRRSPYGLMRRCPCWSTSAAIRIARGVR